MLHPKSIVRLASQPLRLVALMKNYPYVARVSFGICLNAVQKQVEASQL